MDACAEMYWRTRLPPYLLIIKFKTQRSEFKGLLFTFSLDLFYRSFFLGFADGALALGFLLND